MVGRFHAITPALGDTSAELKRFFRAKLPSPKRYLLATRLMYVGAFLETPGVSLADVVHR